MYIEIQGDFLVCTPFSDQALIEPRFGKHFYGDICVGIYPSDGPVFVNTRTGSLKAHIKRAYERDGDLCIKCCGLYRGTVEGLYAGINILPAYNGMAQVIASDESVPFWKFYDWYTVSANFLRKRLEDWDHNRWFRFIFDQCRERAPRISKEVEADLLRAVCPEEEERHA